MTKYMLRLIFLCALPWCGMVSAQSLRLVVTDSATGSPIEGAMVRKMHGGGLPIYTDGKGMALYSEILPKDTLMVIRTGYKLQYISPLQISKEWLHILLCPLPVKLEDVTVNTGYQTLPKERATGSFYKIDGNLLDQRASSNILDRIESLASGVLYDKRSTDEPTKIQVRGLSTLTDAIARPLIIVDNFPYSGDLSAINPNDIKDVTILKDAAAASIWGARAGNGVIVISLKEPSVSQRPKVTFNAITTITKKMDLSQANQMTSPDYIDVESHLFEQGFYSWQFNNPSYPAITPVTDILYRQQQGLLSVAQATAAIDSLRGLDVRRDMEKYLYRSAIEQQYNLGMTGGSNNFKYLFSVGYNKALQGLKGNSNGRVSIHWNNTVNINSKFTLGSDILYTENRTTANSPGGYGSYSMSTGVALYPYASLVNNDGSAASLDIYWNKNFTDTAGKGNLLDWKYRPLQELKNNDHTTLSRQLLTTWNLNYALDPYLNIDVKGQYGITASNNRNYRSLNSFYTRNLINTFTNLNGASVNAKNPVPVGGILDDVNTLLTIYDFRGQLNYNRKWNDMHSVNAIAGAEIRQEKTDNKTYRTYGYNADNLTSTNVDLVNSYPTYDNLYGSQYISTPNEMGMYINRFVSYYGNMSYSYLNTYTLSASIRKDRSNIFGVNANQKGVPLWSIGAAWNVSREAFYTIGWLPYLNLRLTYGKSGNVNNSVSALATIQYRSASLSSINQPLASIANYPNPDLRWEKVGTFNAGIDFKSSASILTGSLEYYTKLSTDLLQTYNLDLTSGVYNIIANSASIKGHGVDLVLNSENIRGALHWNSSLLFSYACYKVLKMNYSPSLVNFTSNGTYIFPLVGYSPYLIASYKWGGLDSQGNPLGYANGELTTDYSKIQKDSINQQVISGPALPLFLGNLRNQFSFHGISLAFNIAYKLGYYLRKPSLNYYNLFYYGQGNKEYANRWQKAGDEEYTHVPSMQYPVNQNRETFYSYSSINVINAGNIRLTDIYIGYDVTAPVIKRHFSAFIFFGQMGNLNVLLWKANKAGIDPDFPTGIKTPLTISFGLRCGL